MTRDEYRNNARMVAHRGVACPNAKLDDAIVAVIRRQHARKQRLIDRLNKLYSAKGFALRYGVHVRTIEKVLTREGWIHVREDLA